MSALPGDVQAVIDRITGCTHFAGEFGGDPSARDREVTATMTALRCDTVERDAAAMRRRYADVPAVQAALASSPDS